MDKIAILQRELGALDGQSATPPEGYVFWALGKKYPGTPCSSQIYAWCFLGAC